MSGAKPDKSDPSSALRGGEPAASLMALSPREQGRIVPGAAQGARCRADGRHANNRGVNPDWFSIETSRLILRTIRPAALAALVAGDRAEASRLTGCELGDFPEE